MVENKASPYPRHALKDLIQENVFQNYMRMDIAKFEEVLLFVKIHRGYEGCDSTYLALKILSRT